MRIAIGTDHAGFALKATVIEVIEQLGHVVLDCGAMDAQSSDYPDYARLAAEAILAGKAQRAVLLCGSGVGISIAANKVPGIRAAICHDTYSARQAVEHDGLNVLCLGGRVIGPALAVELVRAFLDASDSTADRHRRRLEKVNRIEFDARRGRFGAPDHLGERRFPAGPKGRDQRNQRI